MALILLASAFAGCTGSDAPAETDDGGDRGGVDGSTGAGGTDDDGTSTADGGDTTGAGENEGEASGSAPTWDAYSFTQDVTPASGGAGRVSAYAFTFVDDDGDGRREFAADVTFRGVATEDVRTTRMAFDMSAGESSEEVVTSAVDLQRVDHVLTLVEDASSDLEPGSTADVSVYLVPDATALGATYSFLFPKFTVDTASEDFVWEYWLTEEMQAEQKDGVMYVPYTEGGTEDWWGFEVFWATYGFSWFSGLVKGQQGLEEGSASYGGYTWSTERTTFEVGGYTFDGYNVTTSMENEDGTQSMSIVVSPDLPVPYLWRVSSEGESPSLTEYRLTDLTLE